MGRCNHDSSRPTSRLLLKTCSQPCSLRKRSGAPILRFVCYAARREPPSCWAMYLGLPLHYSERGRCLETSTPPSWKERIRDGLAAKQLLSLSRELMSRTRFKRLAESFRHELNYCPNR